MNKKIILLISAILISTQICSKKDLFDISHKDLLGFDTSLAFAHTQIPVLSAAGEHIDQHKFTVEMLENIRIANDIDLEISKIGGLKNISGKELINLTNKFNNSLIHRRHKYINLCKLNIKNPKKTEILAHGIPSRIGKSFEKLSSEYTHRKINFVHLIESVVQQYVTNKTSNFFVQYKHSLEPNTKKYTKVSLVHIINTKNGPYILFIGNSEVSLEHNNPITHFSEKILSDKEFQSKHGNNLLEHILGYYETNR